MASVSTYSFEGDFVEARFKSRADSDDAIKTWIDRWNDDAVLRKVLRKVQHRLQE